MKKLLQLTAQILLLITCITANIAALYHVVDGTVTYSDGLNISQYEEIKSVKLSVY